MQLVRFRPGDRAVADHFYGVQQTLDGLRLALQREFGDRGGVIGSATNNGKVEERTPTASPAGVQVRGPAVLLVPLTPPVNAPLAYVGAEPFVILTDSTELDVPALDTIAGQTRHDLIVANINVGQFSTFAFQAIAGNPDTTGTQVDPAVPVNSLVLARITRAHGAGDITNAMITDLRTYAAQGSEIVYPLLYNSPLVAGTFSFVANEARGVRCVMPRSGRLRDLSVYVGTASGNYDIGVLDSTLTTRSFLYRKGTTAVPTAGSWQILGDPNVEVKRGDYLDLVLALDNATAAVGRGTSLTAPAAGDLPPGFLQVPVALDNKLVWTRATSFPLPATLAESGLTNGASNYPLIIARIV